MKDTILTFLVAVIFGVALSRIGFTSWDEVHAMFVFSDLRMLLSFMFAVALLIPGWFVLARFTGKIKLSRKIHPGTIVGGVLFGAGWAISGACPSIGMVQLGEGQLGAVWTILGMLLGNAIYSWVHPKFFGWSTGSCLDE